MPLEPRHGYLKLIGPGRDGHVVFTTCSSTGCFLDVGCNVRYDHFGCSQHTTTPVTDEPCDVAQLGLGLQTQMQKPGQQQYDAQRFQCVSHARVLLNRTRTSEFGGWRREPQECVLPEIAQPELLN